MHIDVVSIKLRSVFLFVVDDGLSLIMRGEGSTSGGEGWTSVADKCRSSGRESSIIVVVERRPFLSAIVGFSSNNDVVINIDVT